MGEKALMRNRYKISIGKNCREGTIWEITSYTVMKVKVYLNVLKPSGYYMYRQV